MALLEYYVDSNGEGSALSDLAAPKAPSTSGPSPHLDTQGSRRAAFQVPSEATGTATEDEGFPSCRHHTTTSQ